MPDIISIPEFVVVGEDQADLVPIFHDHGISACVHRMPFGMQLPKSFTDRPSELINVGGSVSVDFAVAAIMLAHELCPHLKYVHLTVDADNHFTTPEECDYQIVLNCRTENAEKYKCQPWTDEDFAKLQQISRQSDFHYYVRNLYQKSAMIVRGNYTIIKYIGGIHDGETLRMQGPPQAIAQLGVLDHIRRQDGTGVDAYTPRVNGDVLEYHYCRTARQ